MAAITCASAHVLARTNASQSGASRSVRGPESSRAALVSNFTGIQLTSAPATPVLRPAAKKSSSVTCGVAVGDVAPDVTLLDQDGKTFSLSKLKGKKNVVLYFYPADDTPGCTKQACSFRDSFETFADLGAEVIGVSGDSPESHKKFAEKYDLPFRLLSDEGNAVRKEFGIPADLFGFLPGRQTYVIDKKGVVQLVFNSQFKFEKHVEETVALLEELPDDDEGFKLPAFSFPKFSNPFEK